MSFQFSKLSVLVVEDTLPMQQLVTSVLDVMGVGSLDTAVNGEEGFKTFIRTNPDIVIADWQMEPISGIELAEKIRNDKRSPNRTVPIIMMTGFSALPRVYQARDTGITEFIVKPFSAKDLARRLAHVVNKPRDFVETRDFFGPDRRRRKHSPSYRGIYRRDSDL